MANNYQEWSTMFPWPKGKEKEAQEWVRQAVGPPPDKVDEEEMDPWRDYENCDGRVDFTVDIEQDGLYLYVEQCGNLEQAVELVQEMWRRFGDGTEVGTIEWADWCDKPRTDEFGGGVVAFTRDATAWRSTGVVSVDLVHQLERRRKNVSRYRKAVAVVHSIKGEVQQIVTYKHEADAWRAAATSALTFIMENSAFSKSERQQVKSLYDTGDHEAAVLTFQVACRETPGVARRLTVQPCHYYTQLKRP